MVVGLLIIVVVLGAMYYLSQQGFFTPLTQFISDITTGFDTGYYGYGRPSSTVSRYYHQAAIRFVSLAEGQNELGQVIIVAHPQDFGFLKVTDWKLKTGKGTFRIPQAYNAFSPSTAEAAPENIVMREGDRLYLITGESPNGRNERVSAGEWHVFLGDFLPRDHSRLQLFDASSTLVDEYEY